MHYKTWTSSAWRTVAVGTARRGTVTVTWGGNPPWTGCYWGRAFLTWSTLKCSIASTLVSFWCCHDDTCTPFAPHFYPARFVKLAPRSRFTQLLPFTTAAHGHQLPMLQSIFALWYNIILVKFLSPTSPPDLFLGFSEVTKNILFINLNPSDSETKMFFFLENTQSIVNAQPAQHISAQWPALSVSPLFRLSTCLERNSIQCVCNTITIVLSPILQHRPNFHARYNTERGYSVSVCITVCMCVRYLPPS